MAQQDDGGDQERPPAPTSGNHLRSMARATKPRGCLGIAGGKVCRRGHVSASAFTISTSTNTMVSPHITLFVRITANYHHLYASLTQIQAVLAPVLLPLLSQSPLERRFGSCAYM